MPQKKSVNRNRDLELLGELFGIKFHEFHASEDSSVFRANKGEKVFSRRGTKFNQRGPRGIGDLLKILLAHRDQLLEVGQRDGVDRLLFS